MLASLATDRGDLDRARVHFREALAIREAVTEEAGPAANQASVTALLCNLGVFEASAGDLAAAQAWYERALAHAKRHRDDTGIGILSANLALTLFEQGKLERVRELAAEGLQTIRRTSSVANLWAGLCPMILIEIAEGRLPDARGHVLEGLSSLGREPDVASWIGMLEAAADYLGARGQAEEATEILGAVDAARKRRGIPVPIGFQPTAQRREARLREALGTDAFVSAWTRGRARSSSDTVEFALQAV
jgi:tetratricopeptide (TPR) repeat protein